MEIELNGAKLRVYEDGTIERLKGTTWNTVKGSIDNKGYIIIFINYKLFKKHRVIALAYLGLDITNSQLQIDHIDRNPSNNNVSNLRIVSNQQNAFNQKAKGCHFNKVVKKWHSKIKLNGTTIGLGYFENEEEARNAYLEAKEKYHSI
jgi:hypothetical protein